MPTAVVLGGSGAVGKEVVAALCKNATPWVSVHVFGRRRIPEFDAFPKVTQHLVEMDDAAAASAGFATGLKEAGDASAAFNLMGVGTPSKSTEEELTRIDFAVPAAFASAAKAAGVRHLSVLSAVGADKEAKPGGFLGFGKTSAGGGLYNMLKGKIEDKVESLGFESASTFRPATLIGTPNTPASIAWLSPKIDGLLPPKYKQTYINVLGAAMVQQAERALAAPPAESGLRVYEGAALHEAYAETGVAGRV
tara:strand:- start:317 stop:1069 length:753 start_codon:yes stop_codon:yes gene_type:complete